MGRELSGGDFLFLGFLARRPRSAYDVKKAMAGSVSFFWSAQHSQVYQQARRLRRDGYVEQMGAPAGRNRRLLGLTEPGRLALAGWLESPAEDYRIYDEALAKLFLSELGSTDAAVRMLEGRLVGHQARLAEFEALRDEVPPAAEWTRPPYPRYTLDLGIRVEQAYIDWAVATLRDLLAYGQAPVDPDE